MTRARFLLASAGWTYGAQLITIVLQFAYAAITSRAVDDSGFGAYAVALSIAAFATLLANGGLGQAVGRSITLNIEVLRGMLMYALIVGCGMSAVLLLSADWWAALWGTPSAAPLIRWLALSTLAAPTLGLLTGYLRRESRFKLLAQWTLVANVAGMSLGAVAVSLQRTPESLLISPIIAQWATVVLCLAASRGVFLRLRGIRNARLEIRYSWGIIAYSAAAYVTGNIGLWSLARFFGPALLGQWNRADVVAYVPFQQLQSALTRVIYPEFRHDRQGNQRAREVWSDALCLVSWIVFPAGAAVAALSPALIPILFGPGWLLAAQIATPLALIGAFQINLNVLGVAIESLGRFGWLWAGQVAALAATGVGAVLAVWLGEWWLVLVGVSASMVASHGVHLVLSWRAGYVRLGFVLRNYAMAGAVGAGCFGIVLLLIWALRYPSLLSVGVSAGALIGVAAATFSWRDRLPPLVLARKYGLLGGSSA